MGNKFDFEKYPNYHLFKKNMIEKPSIDECENKNLRIQAQQVIAEKNCSSVIEFALPFPEKYPAFELIDSATDIKGITTNILKDIILISGYIHKRISYICFEGSYSFRDSNISADSTIGNIKVLSSDIPFSCSSEVFNIQATDKIDIEYAGTDSSDIIDILDNPMIMTQDRVTLYKSLKEKLIINIHLKVLRSIQTRIY